MALAVEPELDPVVDEPFAQQPLSGAGLHEHVDHALLEHAGLDPSRDVLPARSSRTTESIPAVQEMTEGEASWAGADDAYLSPRAGRDALLHQHPLGDGERAVRRGAPQ